MVPGVKTVKAEMLGWVMPGLRKGKKWPPKWPPTPKQKKKQAAASLQPPVTQPFKMVGARRVELLTFCTPNKHANRINQGY